MDDDWCCHLFEGHEQNPAEIFGWHNLTKSHDAIDSYKREVFPRLLNALLLIQTRMVFTPM